MKLRPTIPTARSRLWCPLRPGDEVRLNGVLAVQRVLKVRMVQEFDESSLLGVPAKAWFLFQVGPIATSEWRTMDAVYKYRRPSEGMTEWRDLDWKGPGKS